MEITFQNTSGRKFAATLDGDRLSDIRQLRTASSAPSPAMAPGTGEGEGEGEPFEAKPEATSPKPMKQADKVFVEQLKAVLVNNRARKQLRHKQKGILDSRKLVQTQLDSTSVWRQHNRKDSQRNYSVLLLVDESGSMSGCKAELAQSIAQEMTANLGLVDGVDTAVVGFSGNRLVERKRFDDTGRNSLDSIVDSARGRALTPTAQIIDSLKSTDCENADLAAIEYSLHYLRKNADPKSKLVFVMLSDGAPCSSPQSITVVTADMRTEQFACRAVRKGVPSSDIAPMHTLVRKAPDVLSFGLGMLQGGHQIPKHKVVNNIADTRKELIAFLRSALI